MNDNRKYKLICSLKTKFKSFVCTNYMLFWAVREVKIKLIIDLQITNLFFILFRKILNCETEEVCITIIVTLTIDKKKKKNEFGQKNK